MRGWNSSTIRYHDESGHQGAVEGKFIKVGDEILLRAGNTTTYHLDEVAICSGSYGSGIDGLSQLPRPEIKDNQGRVIQQADRLLILFLDGSNRRPVVIPGARIFQDQYLPRTYTDAPGVFNAVKYRRMALDGNAQELGHVDIEICVNDQGTLTAKATHQVALQVAQNPDASDAMAVAITPQLVTIGGNSAQPVTLEALQSDLAIWVQELTTALSLIGVVVPSGPTFIANLQLRAYSAQKLKTE